MNRWFLLPEQIIYDPGSPLSQINVNPCSTNKISGFIFLHEERSPNKSGKFPYFLNMRGRRLVSLLLLGIKEAWNAAVNFKCAHLRISLTCFEELLLNAELPLLSLMGNHRKTRSNTTPQHRIIAETQKELVLHCAPLQGHFISRLQHLQYLCKACQVLP